MTLQHLPRLPKAAVIVLIGFLMTRVAGFMSYPLIALHVTNHLGFRLSELGFLIGIPPAGSLTLSIPFGLLVDRIGGRATVIMSTFAATLAYVLLERAQEPCLIYLAIILIGAYRASFNAPGMAILASSGASEDVKLLFSLQFIAINIDATRHTFVSRQLTQSIGSGVKIFGGSVAKSDGSVREAGRALFMGPTVLSQIFIHGRFGV
jgi:predicted MFS family arabinose efflux permease